VEAETGATSLADQTDQPDASQQQQAQNPSVAENSASEDAGGSDAETAEWPGEKFPATRLDELAVPDVNESSVIDINYAINEMFARHGAVFKDKEVIKEFTELPWYQPRPGVTLNQIETEFSDLEKQNLKVLRRCRDAKLAAARRKPRAVRGERIREESTEEQIIRGILHGVSEGFPQ
jgi:hypothetical protein